MFPRSPSCKVLNEPRARLPLPPHRLRQDKNRDEQRGLLMNSYFRQQRLQHPAIKSAGGADGLSVPPLTSTREVHRQTTARAAPFAAPAYSFRTTDSKAVLAAAHGARPEEQRCDPSSAPSTVAPQISVAALPRSDAGATAPVSPARHECWYGKWLAGYHRQAQRRAQDLPPPSPCAPSSAIILFIIYPFTTPPDAGYR